MSQRTMDSNGGGDSSSDEEGNGSDRPEPAELSFCDEGLQSSVLGALDMMRRNRYFCDVVLHVTGTEVHAHRAVLAAVSPRLFELFSVPASANGGEGGSDSHTALTACRLDGVDPVAFRLLVDYAYTGQLRAPFARVRALHEAARSLRMERAAAECARHLVAHLSPDSCVWTRALVGVSRDPVLRRRVDQYIAAEFSAVRRASSLLTLPRLHADVLQRSRHELALVDGDSLCRLVLEWARRQPADTQLLCLNGDADRDRDLNTYLLYVAADNTLRDCRGLPAGDAADTDLVRAYKRSQQRRDTTKAIEQLPLEQPRPARPRVLIDSRDSSREPDWAVVACERVTERNFVALAIAGGRLCSLFVRLRLDEAADIATAEVDETPSPVYRALTPMPGGGRCGVGCAPLGGALLVCGGYDRVECLRTVERYEPRENVWYKMPALREPRGRFQAAALLTAVYVAGGSSGTTELATMEVLREGATNWTVAARLPLARSEAGLCAALGEDTLLCVGGWEGQAPACHQCDKYEASLDRWVPAPPLNAGRYQAGVCALGGGPVYAAGGCDAWSCLRTVERYDVRTGRWESAAPLATARRGCGVAELHGRLYAVGGSDGARSLSSTEVYDAVADRWMHGPPLTTPRANVAVSVVGDRLYAIGGFSAGSFLDTIEYLDVTTGEWTAFTPDQH